MNQSICQSTASTEGCLNVFLSCTQNINDKNIHPHTIMLNVISQCVESFYLIYTDFMHKRKLF